MMRHSRWGVRHVPAHSELPQNISIRNVSHPACPKLGICILTFAAEISLLVSLWDLKPIILKLQSEMDA